MATLEKIRNKAGLLVIVVGVALFAFIIGDFLNSGSTYFRQSQEKVISVNGEDIDIQKYQELIDEMTEVYKMQTGSGNIPEEAHGQIRESVYNGLVQEIVVGEQMELLGMTVSPEELFDMVQGENISPMLQQNPMFTNPQTGAFDKNALLNFLKMIDDDNINSYPAEQQGQLLQARGLWMFWEKNIKRQCSEEKYTSLLTKAVATNKLEAKNAFDGDNITSDVAYVMQSYSTVPDSTITVSRSELDKLYNQRKESYKQKETRVINYISVDIRPSKEDYDKAQKELESVKSEFVAATNVADVVNENSDVPYIDAFVAPATLEAEIRNFAETAETGDVEGPIFQSDKYRMYKLVDKTVGPDSVKVSHIMLAGQSEAQTQALADSLIDVLKRGGNFEELAKEFSVDQSSDTGGELGWFTEAFALRGVNEDFKNTVFSAKINDVNLVKSLYGVHIVKVTEATPNITKYKVADIVMNVTPSSTTYSDTYNSLNQFVSNNNTVAKMEENAKDAGYTLRSGVNVTAADQTLAAIRNSRQVVRWVFQSEKGKISDIFEADNKFVVAAVSSIVPEGYRSLASVESELKSEIIREKKGEKIAQDLKSQNISSLTAYASPMQSKVDTVRFVTFNTRRLSGIGVEPKLNAAITYLSANQVSEPLAGTNGVYVFNPLNRSEGSNAYNEEEQIRSLDASKMYMVGYASIQALIDNAEIEDNRIRFY